MPAQHVATQMMTTDELAGLVRANMTDCTSCPLPRARGGFQQCHKQAGVNAQATRLQEANTTLTSMTNKQPS
jgi:hypothetical protein